MKISTDTPIGTIVIHEKHGAGVLRFNRSIEQQGKDCLPSLPHRLVQVEFHDSKQWRYVLPDEEFVEIIPSSAHDVANA